MKYKEGDLVRIVSCDVNPSFVGRNGIVVKALQADVPLYKVMVSGETVTDYATEDCLETMTANSIWHSMSECPIKGKVILVQTKDTFYGVSVQKGGTTYKNKNKDRYIRWAYISDLLNLSNVERTVKNWKEPVSEELEETAHKYADGENPTCPCEECLIRTFKVGAKWKKAHNWKPADGDDLPEIDREVVALLDNGKVVFAHRPPEYWDGKDIVTGKVTRNYPKTYDKGGWNIPNVKWWLDCSLPNMED